MLCNMEYVWYKRKKYVSLILMLLMMHTISAFNVDYGVYDINTNIPLSSVNVSLYNQSNNIVQVSGLTNNEGLVSLSVTTQSNDYYIYARKIGYEDYYNLNYNITNETQDNLYMRPFSTSGIIRIKVSDLTLSEHDYCVYFKDNNRLYDCFKLNDTLILHNNYEYIIRIRLNKLDMYSSPDMISQSLKRNVYIFIGICLIICLIVVFVVLYKRGVKGK